MKTRILPETQTDSTLLILSTFHESWPPSLTSRPFRSSRSVCCPCSRPQLACSPYRSTGPCLRSVCSPCHSCTTQSHTGVTRNSKVNATLHTDPCGGLNASLHWRHACERQTEGVFMPPRKSTDSPGSGSGVPCPMPAPPHCNPPSLATTR